MRLEPYEEIEHTADWAIIVRGETLDDLFENAARGMFSLLDARYEEQQVQKKELQLSAIDQETLLVTWLEELLYMLESEQFASSGFEVDVKDTTLEADVMLHPLRSMKKDIKAVTYNELEIVRDDQGFHTTIVFDV